MTDVDQPSARGQTVRSTAAAANADTKATVTVASASRDRPAAPTMRK